MICGIADCDTRYRHWCADGRRAYCGGAEGADWAADAGSQRYFFSDVIVAGLVIIRLWFPFKGDGDFWMSGGLALMVDLWDC